MSAEITKEHKEEYNYKHKLGNLYIDEDSGEVVMMLSLPDSRGEFDCVVMIPEDHHAPQFGERYVYNIGYFSYFKGSISIENDGE